MANDQLSDKIEAWLKGKLPPAEAAAFQAEIVADPALAEEVDLHRLTLYAMDHLSEQHLQQNVLTWMEGVDIDDVKEEPEKELVSSPYRNWFLVAAALLLLTGAFVFYQIWKSGAEKQRYAALESEIKLRDSLLFELKQNPSSEPAKIDSLILENTQLRSQLLEATKNSGKPPGPFAYYSKPKDLGGAVRMGEASSVEKLLKDGAVLFQKSDLKQAEDKARAALQIDTANREAFRLLAHALFGQQRFLEAAPVFARMQDEYTQSSDEAKEAEWNRLLCHRALSADAVQRELFHAALEAILKDPGHPYYVKAKGMKAVDEKNTKAVQNSPPKQN